MRPTPTNMTFYRRPGERFTLPEAEQLCAACLGEFTILMAMVGQTLDRDRPGSIVELSMQLPRTIAETERPYFLPDDDVVLGWLTFRYSDRHPDARVTARVRLDTMRLWVDDNFGVLGPPLGRWCLKDENLVPVEQIFRPAQGLDGNRWGIGEGNRKAPPPRG